MFVTQAGALQGEGGGGEGERNGESMRWVGGLQGIMTWRRKCEV